MDTAPDPPNQSIQDNSQPARASPTASRACSHGGVGVCLNCVGQQVLYHTRVDRSRLHPSRPSLVRSSSASRARDRAAEQPSNGQTTDTDKRGPGPASLWLPSGKESAQRSVETPLTPGSVGRLALDLDCKRGIDPICPNPVPSPSPPVCVPPRRICARSPDGAGCPLLVPLFLARIPRTGESVTRPILQRVECSAPFQQIQKDLIVAFYRIWGWGGWETRPSVVCGRLDRLSLAPPHCSAPHHSWRWCGR